MAVKVFVVRYYADDDELDRLEMVRTKYRRRGYELTLDEIFHMAVRLGLAHHLECNLDYLDKNAEAIMKNRGIPV